MTSLPIDGIQLQFDGAWTVAKWDDSRWYLDGIAKLNGELDGRAEGTKAVDVIGLRDEVPYLLEVKDLRGFAIEKQKWQPRELPLEVGLKARDTVAGLLGWVALDKHDELPRRWIHAIGAQQRAVHVVALVAEDAARPAEPQSKRLARESVRAGQLRQRLAWLTPRVTVSDPLRDADFMARLGITATSQAGAGPARSRP